MVNNNNAGLDAAFAALSDPTRRAILARLAEGEASVGELADPHDMSLPAVSKHLNVLESAGLISRRREGRTIRCRMDDRPLRAANAWIEHYRRFWIERLESLADYLENWDDD